MMHLCAIHKVFLSESFSVYVLCSETAPFWLGSGNKTIWLSLGKQLTCAFTGTQISIFWPWVLCLTQKSTRTFTLQEFLQSFYFVAVELLQLVPNIARQVYSGAR